MLKQLTRFRVPLFLGTFTLVWFLFGVLPKMVDGQRLFPAVWAAIKEVRPMEWVILFCLWLSVAFPLNQNKTAKTNSLGLSGQK